MKTPLTVGDRVACYHVGWRYVGTVERLGESGIVFIGELGFATIEAHMKQCRRIKKRPVPVTVYIAGDDIPGENTRGFHCSVAGPEYVAEQRRRGSKAIWHEFKEVVSVKETTNG